MRASELERDISVNTRERNRFLRGENGDLSRSGDFLSHKTKVEHLSSRDAVLLPTTFLEGSHHTRPWDTLVF